MVRIMVTRAAVALLFVMALAVGKTQAEVYIFSGVLPGSAAEFEAYDVAGTDLAAYDWFGASWTVTLQVNTGVLDDFGAFSDWGYYSSAVSSAKLLVSNGYELTISADAAQRTSNYSARFRCMTISVVQTVSVLIWAISTPI